MAAATKTEMPPQSRILRAGGSHQRRNRLLLLLALAAGVPFVFLSGSHPQHFDNNFSSSEVAAEVAVGTTPRASWTPYEEEEATAVTLTEAATLGQDDRLDGPEEPPHGMDIKRASKLTLPQAFIPDDAGDDGTSSSSWLREYVNPCSRSSSGSGGSGEVKCVPYFYILGSFHSGALDLFERLKQHPRVAALGNTNDGKGPCT